MVNLNQPIGQKIIPLVCDLNVCSNLKILSLESEIHGPKLIGPGLVGPRTWRFVDLWLECCIVQTGWFIFVPLFLSFDLDYSLAQVWICLFLQWSKCVFSVWLWDATVTKCAVEIRLFLLCMRLKCSYFVMKCLIL